MQRDQQSLKIVMVVENNTYPADTRVRNEAESLAAAGFDVTVICPHGKNQAWRETIKAVRTLRFPAPPSGAGYVGYFVEFGYGTIITVLFLLWVWLSRGLDVVHVHNPPDTLFAAGLLPKLAGKKLIYDHHDLAPELYLSKYEVQGGLAHRILLALEKSSCRFADFVITVNESYRKVDATRNGVSCEKIIVVRNGPVLDDVQLHPPDPDLRARAKTIIGYVGNIAHQDGLDHLLRALHHLQRDLGYEDWFSVIIGNADNAKELQKLADDLEINNKVWFTGYLSGAPMLSLLSASDICVVPDPSNPLNDKSTMIKVMEYMALKKPIVAYDLTETMASAGKAALYAKANDPLDMARQMYKLIESPQLRAQLGVLGRQRIESQLSWDYSAERLVELYRNIQGTMILADQTCN